MAVFPEQPSAAAAGRRLQRDATSAVALTSLGDDFALEQWRRLAPALVNG